MGGLSMQTRSTRATLRSKTTYGKIRFWTVVPLALAMMPSPCISGGDRARQASGERRNEAVKKLRKA
jgi:hypothetical protein